MESAAEVQAETPTEAMSPAPVAAGVSTPSSTGRRAIRKPQRFVDDVEVAASPRKAPPAEEPEVQDVDEWGDLEIVKCPSHFCDTCHDIYVRTRYTTRMQ
jgi:hypothetical protein